MKQSIKDVIAERVKQDKVWGDFNSEAGYNVDEYIGIALHYIGNATMSYHNPSNLKRVNLIKAAAVLLQIIDRVDANLLAFKEPKIKEAS